MKVRCCDKSFPADEIIRTSRTIKDAVSDTEMSESPNIPDEYLDCLEMKILPFPNVQVRLNIRNFFRVSGESLEASSNDDFFNKKDQRGRRNFFIRI